MFGCYFHIPHCPLRISISRFLSSYKKMSARKVETSEATLKLQKRAVLLDPKHLPDVDVQLGIAAPIFLLRFSVLPGKPGLPSAVIWDGCQALIRHVRWSTTRPTPNIYTQRAWTEPAEAGCTRVLCFSVDANGGEVCGFHR